MLKPSRFTIGPLTVTSGSQPGVEPPSWIRNSGSEMASAIATRIGMYSGRQPAITPLTATDHTVASRLAGSSVPNTSSGSRGVWAMKRSTRSSVGGITGSPSVQRRSSK